MCQSNTLFILANWGLKTDPSGIFESHMWLLDEIEEKMEFISLHKSKAKRAYKGGKILKIRTASRDEIENHQALMIQHNNGPMININNRKIIVFQYEKNWNEIWPKSIKTNPMAYKGIEFVEWD